MALLILAALLLAGCSGAATTDPPAPAPDQGGSVATRVVDGDTFAVSTDGSTEKVRVLGIDTPERDECGYAEASDAAGRLLMGTSVRLTRDPTQDDRDRYGRVLRYVTLPDGSDLGNRLLADGFAREYTYDRAYQRQDEYRAAQTGASSAGRGLWNADTCGGLVGATSVAAQPTAETTAAAPGPAEPSSAATASTGPPSADCVIKGNISLNGRIYHLPGGRDYTRTSIDTSSGERWFCSVEEAEAAGWRASGNG